MSFLVSLAGYLTIAIFLQKLFRSLYNVVFPYLFAVPQNIKVLAGAEWAVVTGSTDGIGKAYALELAKKNFNIVLISRSMDKLNAVAEEIKQKYPNVEVKCISFDFTNANLKDYEQTIFSQLSTIEIGMLVNNVGMSYEYPERLDRIEGGLQRVSDITVINTLPTTVLSAFVLKQMRERGRGVVVNLASSAAYFNWFYLAVYSASKKYVCWLSSILRMEYADTDIVIQTVCPMMVATKMAKIRKASFFTPSPEEFAAQALRSIGLVDETTGCLSHQIQAELMFGYVPAPLLNKFVRDNSLQTRKRALKKKEATVAKSE
ncbi:hypothetical protein niasHT_024830 [Heterodera trifolii]|uniref:Uncharacterized protein n=1 Tax=Heterodera trifolii TaxID=157864 RepID=A0ABD2JDW9_9BILA